MSPRPPDPRRDFAVAVVRRLRDEGHVALWAGGSVRDLILGLDSHDYDVATDAVPEQVMRIFPRSVPVGIAFGVVRVRGPRASGEIEVATFRADGHYADGRRPDSVRFSSPEEDARRRDFTINGMFYDPVEDRIIDYVGGRDDLGRRLIRAIGSPSERFAEDKLRLLRAVRFACRFAFDLESGTRAAIAQMADQIAVISPERMWQEWGKILTATGKGLGVCLAAELGLLEATFPGLGRHAEEIVKVLDALIDPVDARTAFAAMLTPLGPAVAAATAVCLKMSNDERIRVHWLVANLDAVATLRDAAPATRKRLLAHPGADELLALARARAVAAGRSTEGVEWCIRYRIDQPEGPLDPPPLLSGNDLIGLGWAPGPAFGRVLERLRVAQLDGTITDAETARDFVRRQERD